MDRATANSRTRLSLTKAIAFRVVAICLPLLCVECSARVILAARAGPSAMAYGLTRADPSRNGTRIGFPRHSLGEYRKYSPNRIRFDIDSETGDRFQVKINSLGFRGSDFSVTKAPGVTRIAALGASSTFGYLVREEDTYPHRLEAELNRICGNGAFEVLNLGIPHLASEQVRALFLHEAISFQPDIVLFYQGLNDTASPTGALRRVRYLRAVRDVFHWLRRRSVVVSFAYQSLSQGPRRYGKKDMTDYAKGRAGRFIDNVSAIRDECRRRRITFVVANQQARSMLIEERRSLQGLSYADELAKVRARLDSEGWLTSREAQFVVHAGLMEELEAWAHVNDVLFVDAIRELDGHREQLVSWVHLSARGNDLLAAAFAATIVESGCPGESGN